jgi:hypothetical protein
MEKKKLVVVVPVVGEKMRLQGCWAIVGHSFGKVVVAKDTTEEDIDRAST